MSRRGSPRWPITTAQPIEPMPPAAKTSPRSVALAAELVLDDVRQQHLGRAHEQQVGDCGGRERAPQPDVAADVSESLPDVGADRAAPAAAAGRGRARIESSALAETANEGASSANAPPTPTASISTPPSAGPGEPQRDGRTNWSSELACASSDAGRTSGTIASNAGAKNAAPAPYTATSATTCQSSSTPVSDEHRERADRERRASRPRRASPGGGRSGR